MAELQKSVEQLLAAKKEAEKVSCMGKPEHVYFDEDEDSTAIEAGPVPRPNAMPELKFKYCVQEYLPRMEEGRNPLH